MATKRRKRHKEKQFPYSGSCFLRVPQLFSFWWLFSLSGAAQVQKPAHSAGSTFTKKNHFAPNHFAKI